MSERLCKDCKHYAEPEWLYPRPALCRALDRKQHPVTGGNIDGIEVGLMRMTLCGFADPRFWEPKQKSTDQDSYPTG